MIHFFLVVYRTTQRVVARKAEVRRKLLSAARSCVEARGFSGTTIQEMAHRTGVSTGTVYRYFRSKAALLSTLFTEVAGAEIEHVRRIAVGDGTPADRLEHSIASWARRALRSPRLAYALLAEPLAPEIEGQRLEHRKAYAAVLADLLAEGMARNEFSPGDPVLRAAMLVGALAEALVGPLSPTRTASELDRDRFVAEVVRCSLRLTGYSFASKAS